MLLSKKLTISVLALSLLATAPLMAQKPTTFLGKIGTSIMQTIDKHTIIRSIALGHLTEKAFQLPKPNDFGGLVRNTCIIGAAIMVEETLFQAVKKNFEVEPLK